MLVIIGGLLSLLISCGEEKPPQNHFADPPIHRYEVCDAENVELLATRSKPLCWVMGDTYLVEVDCKIFKACPDKVRWDR